MQNNRVCQRDISRRAGARYALHRAIVNGAGTWATTDAHNTTGLRKGHGSELPSDLRHSSLPILKLEDLRSGDGRGHTLEDVVNAFDHFFQ